jgi:hypothetical protein
MNIQHLMNLSSCSTGRDRLLFLQSIRQKPALYLVSTRAFWAA